MQGDKLTNTLLKPRCYEDNFNIPIECVVGEHDYDFVSLSNYEKICLPRNHWDMSNDHIREQFAMLHPELRQFLVTVVIPWDDKGNWVGDIWVCSGCGYPKDGIGVEIHRDTYTPQEIMRMQQMGVISENEAIRMAKAKWNL